MKYHIFGILCGLAVVCVAPRDRLYAQSDDSLGLSLAELTGKEVVSASKTEQSSAEALASIITISSDEIRRYGYRTFGEALQRVVGLYLSDDRAYQYLGIRGLNFPGDFNGRVLFLVDGHKLTDPNYDYVGLGEDFPLDIEDIDHIEVVKGTGSALWGTNAVVGVINVISKRGRTLQGTNAKVEYGSEDRRKAYLTTGNVTQSGIEYAASASIVRSAGEGTIFYPSFNTPENNFGRSQFDDRTAAQRTYFSLSYKDLHFLLLGDIRKKGMSGAPYDSIFDAPAQTVDFAIDTEVSYLHQVDDALQVFTRVYHDGIGYYEELQNERDDGRAVVNRDRSTTRIAGGEIRASGSLSPQFSYTLGSEFQDAYQLFIKNADFDPYTELYDIHGEYRLWSGYTEERYRLTNAITFVAGGRLDHYSTFGGHLSPRLGAIFNPLVATTLKLFYGESFRAPNNYERNADDGYTLRGNPDLKEEDVHSWELVAQQRIGEAHRVSLSLFHYKLNDLITQLPDADGLLQSQNRGSAQTRGIEGWWNATMSSGLLAYGGLSYTDTEDDAGAHLINSPRVTASAGVSVPLFNSRWYLSPEARYLSTLETPNGESLSGSFVSNLVLVSGEIRSKLDFSVGVYNLFDRSLYSVAGAGYSAGEAPLPGRTVRLQLGVHF